MHEPSPRTSRLAIAGGIAAAIVVGGAGFLIGRSTVPEPPPVSSPVAPPAPTPAPVATVLAPATLDRADLLALVGDAADATSAGGPLPKEVRAAAGRRFDLVLPFGCEGSTAARTAGLGWNYEEDSETLRIQVIPTRWGADAWSLESAEAESGAFEGFWVPRPWSSSTSCPSPAPSIRSESEPVLIPGQTLAIAHPLEKTDSASPPRAFETVQRVARNRFDPDRGFRLRIIGRIVSDDAPVRCVQPHGGEQRPLCLVVGDFTEVRIENPVDGAVLATWPVAAAPPRGD